MALVALEHMTRAMLDQWMRGWRKRARPLTDDMVQMLDDLGIEPYDRPHGLFIRLDIGTNERFGLVRWPF